MTVPWPGLLRDRPTRRHHALRFRSVRNHTAIVFDIATSRPGSTADFTSVYVPSLSIQDRSHSRGGRCDHGGHSARDILGSLGPVVMADPPTK